MGVRFWGGQKGEGGHGAGEGNRTLVVSLGSFCSTIELHPHSSRRQEFSGFCLALQAKWMCAGLAVCPVASVFQACLTKIDLMLLGNIYGLIL